MRSLLRRLRSLAALVALVACAAGPVARAEPVARAGDGAAEQRPERAGEPAAAPVERSARSAEELRVLRERWDRLSPEEQRALRERYERYRRLSEGERQRLLQRADDVRRMAAEVEGALDGDARRKLERLEPRRRREVLHDLVEVEVERRWDRVEAKLPERWRAQLEAAPPDARARALAEFKRVQLERVSRFAIGELGQRLELDPAEIERLAALPPDARARMVLELERRLIERDVRAEGLPAGVDPGEWARLQDLSPDEFFRALMRLRERQLAARAAGDPDPEAAARRRLDRVREALHAAPELLVDVAHLPRAERRAALELARRQRAEAVVRDLQLLSPTELERLERASDRRALEHLRGVLARERRRLHAEHDLDDVGPWGRGRLRAVGPRGRGRGPHTEPPGDAPPAEFPDDALPAEPRQRRGERTPGDGRGRGGGRL